MKFKYPLTSICLFAVLTFTSGYAQDSWNGGTGNWSSPGNWSGGLPVSNSDVLIYSGGNDNVTLDVSPTINSLTLGGVYNGTTSELTDNGLAQTLTIANALNVGRTGYLWLYGGSTLRVNGNVINSGTINGYAPFGGGGRTLSITGNLTNTLNSNLYWGGNSGDVANVNTLINNGFLAVGPNAIFNLQSQPSGVTDIVTDSFFGILGTFTAGNNDGFYHLTNVEGGLMLRNGQTTTTTPIGGTLTISGSLLVYSTDITGGATLNINGNLKTSGEFAVGVFGANHTFPNGVNIMGSLTNTSRFDIGAPNDRISADSFYEFAGGNLSDTVGPNDVGMIVVNGGPVALDGNLYVNLEPGFNPTIGSIYKFVLFQPGELTGTFSAILDPYFGYGQWKVIYDNQDGFVALEAAPAPESASLLLLGTGLLGAVTVLRRKINLQ